MSTDRDFYRTPSETSAAGVEDQNSAQIQRRIDRTRGAMDETIDAIGERLNPRRLVDQVIDSFSGSTAKSAASGLGDAASDFAQQLGKQVRRNPTATLLVGAGLAWMAFSDRSEDDVDDIDAARRPLPRRRSLQDRYVVDPEGYEWDEDLDFENSPDYELEEYELYETEQVGNESPDGPSKTSKAASKAGSKISGAASSTKNSLGSAADATKSAASSASSATARAARRGYKGTRQAARTAYRGAASGGRSIGRSTRQAYRSGSHSVVEAYDVTTERLREAHEDYPLAVGMGCLALGAIAGLMIPRSRQEDSWMGETSDQLVDDVWHAGEEAIRNAKRR